MIWSESSKAVTEWVFTYMVHGIQVDAHIWRYKSNSERWIGHITYRLGGGTTLMRNVGIGENLTEDAAKALVEDMAHHLPLLTWKYAPTEGEIDDMLEGNER